MIERVLPCTLTNDELLDRGRRLSQLQVDLDDAHVAKKRSAEDAKNRIEGIEGSMSELALVIRERSERRTVECTQKADVKAWQIELYRSDTGELVEARAMDEAEREQYSQAELPFEDKA